MPREKVQDLIETKKEYQKKLVEVLKKYFLKFMERLYDKSLREFQEKLIKVPSWSDDKLDKEYSKFLKFVNDKYDLSEEDLAKTLHIVYGLNIKIMTSICDELEVKAPKLVKFWYKCLKKVSKYFYEHPKVMLSESDFKKTKTQIEESINNTLQKFIPLKEIINAKQKEPQDKYNFDNGIGDTDEYSKPSNNDSNNKLEVTLERQSDSNDLKYISSEEFENEYYVSDKEDGNEVKKEKDNKSEEKHIKLPKYLFPNKKNYKNAKFLKNQQNKNELDEHFFDDM
jgi:phage terminase small subunit